MADLPQRQGDELFIVDNSDSDWKVRDYVPAHLLPRIFGYELMMAPYAIAHMRVPLKLKETGFTAWSELTEKNRVNIYLTNSLEPATDDKRQQEFEELAPALAHEARAVNSIKRYKRFTVVLGNPPYSLYSANLGDDARSLIEPYRFVQGQRIRERGALQLEKNLQDDYVKFFAFSESLHTASKTGILSFISNSGYLAACRT